MTMYTVKLKTFLLFCLLSSFSLAQASDKPLIKIETERTSLIYQVGDNGRLYQKYLGKSLATTLIFSICRKVLKPI